MSIAHTSLMAYREIFEVLNARRGQVFKALWELGRAACDYQIAKYLLWPINCVTPRRGELVKLGFVEKDYEAPGPPVGNAVTYWRLLEEQPGSHLWREKIRQARRANRRQKSEVRDPPKVEQNTENRTQKTETPQACSSRVSKAGRTLREYQRVRRRKQTVPTAQMMLFA